tara:strand:- start:32 stop:301 length:270 start_codon:yes stop_codon:yes gene_type:complete
LDSFGEIPEDCHVNRYPVDMEEKDEDNVLVEKINEIRASLGWEQIDKGEKPAPTNKEKPTLIISDIAKRIEEEATTTTTTAEKTSYKNP